MRSALGFAGFVTLLAIRAASGQTQPLGPAPAPAPQTPATEMVVTAAEVEVRSGPNPNYYPTGKLFKGTRVQVVNAKDGWIAIKPPIGSKSWISADKVMRGQNPPLAVVIGDGQVAIRPAGWTKGGAPVESTKVSPGTIVVLDGKSETKDGVQWLSIDPVPSELRYLPAEALQPAQAAAVVAAQPVGTPAQILADANYKLAAGNIQQALQLYQHVAALPNATNEDRVFAQNRLASLTGTSTVGTSPVGASPVNLTAPQSDAPRWSVWARLRRAGFEKDGQPMYVLEDNRGQVLLYVATGSGFTLRDYVGKTVALYGTITYRNDGYVRTHIMTATHVATLPN